MLVTLNVTRPAATESGAAITAHFCSRAYATRQTSVHCPPL